MDIKALYTKKEVSTILGVSLKVINGMIRRKELVAIGGYISRAELERIVGKALDAKSVVVEDILTPESKQKQKEIANMVVDEQWNEKKKVIEETKAQAKAIIDDAKAQAESIIEEAKLAADKEFTENEEMLAHKTEEANELIRLQREAVERKQTSVKEAQEAVIKIATELTERQQAIEKREAAINYQSDLTDENIIYHEFVSEKCEKDFNKWLEKRNRENSKEQKKSEDNKYFG